MSAHTELCTKQFILTVLTFKMMEVLNNKSVCNLVSCSAFALNVVQYLSVTDQRPESAHQ